MLVRLSHKRSEFKLRDSNPRFSSPRFTSGASFYLFGTAGAVAHTRWSTAETCGAVLSALPLPLPLPQLTGKWRNARYEAELHDI